MNMKELGAIVAEQMDALERDCPENSELACALTCVVITREDGSAEGRVRISTPILNPGPYRQALLRIIVEHWLRQEWL